MTKEFIPAGRLQYVCTDSRRASKYKENDMYSSVWFQSENKGLIVYYDADSKHVDSGLDFHNDLVDSMNGKNSGTYEGLTMAEQPTNPGKWYIEHSKKYKLI